MFTLKPTHSHTCFLPKQGTKKNVVQSKCHLEHPLYMFDILAISAPTAKQWEPNISLEEKTHSFRQHLAWITLLTFLYLLVFIWQLGYFFPKQEWMKPYIFLHLGFIFLLEETRMVSRKVALCSAVFAILVLFQGPPGPEGKAGSQGHLGSQGNKVGHILCTQQS